MEALIEKCTSEKNTQDNWDLILEICEKYANQEPKACVKAICKRIFHKNPNVSIRAITLLDACSKNCGKSFNRELASKDFSQSIKRNFSNLQRIPSLKLIEIFEKWADEFKNDSELALAAGFYSWVKNENTDLVKQAMDEKKIAKHGHSRLQVAQLRAKEDEDLAQAIALSLKDTTGNSSSSSHPNAQSVSSSNGKSNLYPICSQLPLSSLSMYSTSSPNTTKTTNLRTSKGQVRALYDFEAAEDNELSFRAGELILLLDDSDENWWLGSNSQGQGLFPAQFVKREVKTDGTENAKSNSAEIPQNSDIKSDQQSTTKTIPQLDEQKIDECLRLITTVDPTGEFRQDPPELSQLEAECNAMVPLVDPELKLVDKKLIMLTELNQRLLDAFQLYHDIMSRQNPTNTYFTGTSNTAPNSSINPAMSYLPSNTSNVYPYTQPMSMPASYMTKSSSTLPVNGYSVRTDLNGAVMLPPTDSYPMSAGIYANPQTENFSNVNGGSIVGGQNPHFHASSQPPFPVQQFYVSNQIMSPDMVTQQMQSYPSGGNNYGIPAYSMNESQPMVYTDQQNNMLPTQQP
ncbi:Signal transducing adapter molecule 1 [Schistosoma japonicum]|nr:Signal transducing adapter molecule 1 [Schistosoma japonicum]